MNARIRRMLTATSLSRRLYYAARQEYHVRRLSRRAKQYFRNADEFNKALRANEGSGTVDIQTMDGLSLSIRQNYGDASTIGEIFLYDGYTRPLTLPDGPIVIDLGAFIGDFSLYAVKR